MILDKIEIPDDINKAVIYLNVIIFIAILVYSYATKDNSIFPEPLALIVMSILSIGICLIVWAYQDRLMNRYFKNYGATSNKSTYYRSGYPEKINKMNMVSVVFFMLAHASAVIVQLIK